VSLSDEQVSKRMPALFVGTTKMPTAYSSPAYAACLFNKGGTYVQGCHDAERLVPAVDMLCWAFEIYNENGRTHEAACCATLAAEGYIKLGHHAKARAMLTFAKKEQTRG